MPREIAIEKLRDGGADAEAVETLERAVGDLHRFETRYGSVPDFGLPDPVRREDAPDDEKHACEHHECDGHLVRVRVTRGNPQRPGGSPPIIVRACCVDEAGEETGAWTKVERKVHAGMVASGRDMGDWIEEIKRNAIEGAVRCRSAVESSGFEEIPAEPEEPPPVTDVLIDDVERNGGTDLQREALCALAREVIREASVLESIDHESVRKILSHLASEES